MEAVRETACLQRIFSGGEQRHPPGGTNAEDARSGYREIYLVGRTRWPSSESGRRDTRGSSETSTWLRPLELKFGCFVMRRPLAEADLA